MAQEVAEAVVEAVVETVVVVAAAAAVGHAGRHIHPAVVGAEASFVAGRERSWSRPSLDSGKPVD